MSNTQDSGTDAAADGSAAVRIPRSPAGLKAAGKRFWREMHTIYDVSGSPELGLLIEEAARTADVVQRLQDAVDTAITLRTEGSRGQAVAIPELMELRQYRAQFAALVKQLDLPGPEDEQLDQPGRDRPMSRSESGRIAARARWDNRSA